MTDQSHVRQSSQLTAVHEVATRPHRIAMGIAGRRDLLALLAASGLAISTWAVFPSTVESGIYVPLPEASTPFVAEVNSAMQAVVGGPVTAAKWIDAKLEASKSTMYGSVTLRYPSPVVDVSLVPVRSKLQALLMMLYSRSGDVDPAALEAKLQALLTLPDDVLTQLMQHPDLADLNKMLDAVFHGTSDLSGVKTELDKIDVTSVPGTSEQIQVINVNGKRAYTVHSPAVNEGLGSSVGSPAPPPGDLMTMASQFAARAGLIASAFTLAPSSEELAPPPPPAGLSAPAFTLAPSMEQFTPPAPALLLAPSSEQFTPPPMPTPTSTPTATTPTASVEPTGTAQTSQDVMTSGNKFEPGETVNQGSTGNSPATNSPTTNSPATQSAAPSAPATGGESPTGSGGVTGGGGATSPGNNESGGTSSGEGTSP
jgi:hypothetical protein